MKRLLAILLLWPMLASAAPFVITDILDPAAAQCGVYLDATAKQTIQVTAITGGNICQYDLAAVVVGAHSISMTAITVNDPIWGSQESAKSIPLAFTKPTSPTVPGGLRLRP